eukprot:685898-Amphidinium_carterae.1
MPGLLPAGRLQAKVRGQFNYSYLSSQGCRHLRKVFKQRRYSAPVAEPQELGEELQITRPFL